jgi:hypothetical protein
VPSSSEPDPEPGRPAALESDPEPDLTSGEAGIVGIIADADAVGSANPDKVAPAGKLKLDSPCREGFMPGAMDARARCRSLRTGPALETRRSECPGNAEASDGLPLPAIPMPDVLDMDALVGRLKLEKLSIAVDVAEDEGRPEMDMSAAREVLAPGTARRSFSGGRDAGPSALSAPTVERGAAAGSGDDVPSRSSSGTSALRNKLDTPTRGATGAAPCPAAVPVRGDNRDVGSGSIDARARRA